MLNWQSSRKYSGKVIWSNFLPFAKLLQILNSCNNIANSCNREFLQSHVNCSATLSTEIFDLLSPAKLTLENPRNRFAIAPSIIDAPPLGQILPLLSTAY